MAKSYPFSAVGVDQFRSDTLDEVFRLMEEATPENPVVISVIVGDCRVNIPAFPETFEAMEKLLLDSLEAMKEYEEEEETPGGETE